MSCSFNSRRRSRQQKRRPSSPSSSSSNESEDNIPEQTSRTVAADKGGEEEEEEGIEEHDYQRRKRYSREEQEILQQSFDMNQRPSRGEKQRLAAICNVDTHQIQIWFQNRRAKFQHQSRLKQKTKQDQQGNAGSSSFIPYRIRDHEQEDVCLSMEESNGQQELLHHNVARRTPRHTTRTRILDHEPQQQDVHDDRSRKN